MDFRMRFTILTLIFATINAEMNDQGPQTFDTSTKAPTPSPPSPPQPELQEDQPRYEMREVVVYLTPSQIKALESGKGYLQPVPQQIPNDSQPNIELQQNAFQQEEFQKQLELQKILENQQNAEAAAKAIYRQQHETAPPPPPVEESAEEEKPQEIPPQYAQYGYEPSQPNHNYFLPERTDSVSKSYTYFNLFNKKKAGDVNIKIYHPLPHDTKLSEELESKILETHTDPLLKKKFKLIPYEYLSQKSQDFQFQQQPQDQLQSPLEKYEPEQHLKSLLSAQYQKEYFNSEHQDTKENEERLQEEFIKKKYAPRYNDQKQAIELQNLLKKNSALAKAEAIAKQPPVEIHREVSITKQKPIHIIRHVQVPVPQPYLVRVPEPFEVKVPQPYPVPLEIIRHVPIQYVRTEKIEVEKPVPYEVEKRIPVPVTKKVYVKVDKPYYVHKTVPVEVKKVIPVEIPIRKPEKLTILRHVWEH